jgi:hypothetical protein
LVFVKSSFSYPFFIKWLYVLGPLLTICLLGLIELLRRREIVYIFLFVFILWSSAYNGGLAFNKIDGIRYESDFFYKVAPILNNVQAEKFSIYVTKFNEHPFGNTPTLLRVYSAFFDDKHQKNNDYKSLYNQRKRISNDIQMIFDEDSLAQFSGDYILTDKPDRVIYHHNEAKIISQFNWENTQLYVMLSGK